MAIRRPLENQAALKGARVKGGPGAEDFVGPSKPRSVEELREISNGKGVLSLGDVGPAVVEIQAAMGLEQTGFFDPEMKETVEALQRESGIAVTGAVDADTLFAMNTAFQNAAPLFEKFLGHEQRAAIDELEKLVDEGTGLAAHKRIAATEMVSLGLLTVRNAGEVSNKVGKFLHGAGISKVAGLVGPVLVPITAYYAAKDVRAALAARKDIPSEVQQARAKRATNRAAGSVGYFVSVAAGTTKEVIKASARSSSFLGKLVPGLNMIVAAGDITWATTVCRDPDSSKKKKACACASAVGSVVSMVTPPPISWAASALASGGLLASNFV